MSALTALITPFAKGAEGAQLGDVHSTNSETMTLKGQVDIQLGTYSNGNVHNSFDIALNCHPEQFLLTPIDGPIQMQGGGADAAARIPRVLRDKCDAVKFNYKAANAATKDSSRYLCSMNLVQANTSDTYEFKDIARYRVLGAGVRLTSNMWPESATGHIQVYNALGPDALIETKTLARTQAGDPLADTPVDGNPVLEDVANVDKFSSYYGQPWTYSAESGIALNKNMAQDLKGDKVDIYTFNRHGIEAVFKPYAPEAFEWKEVRTLSLESAGGGAVVVGANTGLANNTYEESAWSVKGWNSICIKGVNLPTASIVTNGDNQIVQPSPLMTLEVVMHIEYVPNKVITNTTGGVPKSRASVDYLIRKAQYYPIFRQLYINRLSAKKMRAKLGY